MKKFTWLGIMYGILFVFVMVVAIIITVNLAQPKINDGYYLNQGTFTITQPSVWINWRNRIDEKAFQHPNINTVLQVYSQLNELLNATSPQPQPE